MIAHDDTFPLCVNNCSIRARDCATATRYCAYVKRTRGSPSTLIILYPVQGLILLIPFAPLLINRCKNFCGLLVIERKIAEPMKMLRKLVAVRVSLVTKAQMREREQCGGDPQCIARHLALITVSRTLDLPTPLRVGAHVSTAIGKLTILPKTSCVLFRERLGMIVNGELDCEMELAEMLWQKH